MEGDLLRKAISPTPLGNGLHLRHVLGGVSLRRRQFFACRLPRCGIVGLMPRNETLNQVRPLKSDASPSAARCCFAEVLQKLGLVKDFAQWAWIVDGQGSMSPHGLM